MKRFGIRALLVGTLIVGSFGSPNASSAQLSGDEQNCIAAFTTSLARVSKVQGSVVGDCLKRFASGGLINLKPEECVSGSLSDSNTKLGKAAFKTDIAANVSCASLNPAPKFGVSSSVAALSMAAGKDIDLVRRIIGPNLDKSLIPVGADARCQVRVAAALQKCADTRMSEYTKCLRHGMKAGSVTDAATLQAVCLGEAGQTQPDPSGRIATQCEEKVSKTIGAYCGTTDLGRAFAPCKSTDSQGVTNCVKRESACKLCQVLNSVNKLSEDCDSFDDGNANDGTCGDECADGIVQSGEGCDDGNTTAGDGCASDCSLESGWGCTGEPSTCTLNCGNGTVDTSDGEECDDGNTTSLDGCSSACQLESCGDGHLDVGETCDDSNHSDGDGCSKSCQTEPGYVCTGEGTPSVCTFVCGNGTFEAGETCDDGNVVNGDGCSGVCKTENGFQCSGQPSVCTGVCGDGLLRIGERCDDGNTNNGDGCANSCQPETGYQCTGEPSICTGICGDSLLRKQETCDDGNTNGGDGCSPTYQQESSWSCIGQPSICTPACGNGRLDSGEQCDDGNTNAGDGCTACTINSGYACAGQPSTCAPTCGNGHLQPLLGEQCDDHNVVNGDGCSSGCTVESGFECAGDPSQCRHTCGNGNIQTGLGEQCDDGNGTSFDGCSSTCKVELGYYCSGQPSVCHLACGNGVLEPAVGEQCDDGNTDNGDGCNDGCFTEVGYYCGGEPSECDKFEIVIDSPAHGSFNDTGTATITGHYTTLPSNAASILINGQAPNQSFNPEQRTFVHRLTLNTADLINPVDATLVNTGSGDDVHARIVVVAGGSVADGNYSPESVALRINESGLASLQPLVASLASSGLDIGSLMPVGRNLIANQCFIDVGILGCWGSASISISSPAPSFASVGLKTDIKTDAVHGDISINTLRVNVKINGSGLIPTCGLRMSANKLILGGDYALEPSMQDMSHVSVDLVGHMSVGWNNFLVNATSGICSWPIISDIITLLSPQVQGLASSAMQGFLDDPDGAGPQKSAVAEGIESALDGVSIAGPVGEGVGMHFDAPMFEVKEDDTGLTIGAHSRFTVSVGTGLGQCVPPPGTPDLTASYSRYEAFPSFGATTPVRGVPYGMGIAISTAGFNQLLRGQTECGLMRTSLTEIDLDGPDGSPALPITSDLLTAFVPEFSLLAPGTPLRIDLAPSMAPMLTGKDGPHGEVADMRIAQLEINIVEVATGTVWLHGAFDARLGLDLAFKPDGSGLAININKPATADMTIRVIDNPLGTNEQAVETVLPNIMAPMIPSLAGALSGFPLPQFFGLTLQGVEVSRNGEFLSLYANLVIP